MSKSKNKDGKRFISRRRAAYLRARGEDVRFDFDNGVYQYYWIPYIPPCKQTARLHGPGLRKLIAFLIPKMELMMRERLELLTPNKETF